MHKNIAIFASGGGSNAAKIIVYFDGHPFIKVVLVVSSHAEAKVLLLAKENNIATFILDKADFNEGTVIKELLQQHGIDFIVLAGFIWLVPSWLVVAYHRNMLNIHPSLLPAHGGKGMYGTRVHEAVRRDGDTSSGMTVHWVTEKYDEGAAVFQASTAITPEDSADDIAKKVLDLEHRYYPAVIEYVIKTNLL